MDVTIVVGLGEVKVSRDASAVLTCLGLGSCVGVAAFDPSSGVGGMAHIVLPTSTGKQGNDSPKYADVGVRELLAQMRRQGADPITIVVKIAGGAKMSSAPGLDGVFKIGDKNVVAVLSALENEGISPAGEETGGNRGRTLKLYLDSGRTAVSHAGQEVNDF